MSSNIPDKYILSGGSFGSVYGESEIREAIAIAEVQKSLSSGSGDASAANQVTQIQLETAIRDRLPSALVSDRLKVDGSAITQPVSGTVAFSNSSIGISSLPSLPSGSNSIGSISVTNFPATQPISAASLPLPSNAATESTLNKMIWVASSLTTSSSSYTSTNGSNKSWTVPSGVEWQIISVYADLVSNATVGNRQLSVRLEDGATNVYCRLPAGTTQSASLTRNYSYAVGLPDFTSFRDTSKLETSLPPIILPSGSVIRILDTSAIDTAGDALTPRALILQRTT